MDIAKALLMVAILVLTYYAGYSHWTPVGIIGETKQINTGLLCTDLGYGTHMIELSGDQVFKDTCSELCANSTMLYAGSFDCVTEDRILVCNCKVLKQ